MGLAQTIRGSRRYRALFACGLSLICSGCLFPKYYIDPQYADATYQDIREMDGPLLVTIDVEYQLKGLKQIFVSKLMRPEAVRALTSTRVFVEADSSNSSEASHLQVIINRPLPVTAFLSGFAKSALCGATYTVVGFTDPMDFEMTTVYTPRGGDPIVRSYKHRAYIGMGLLFSNRDDAERIAFTEFPTRVMEDMLLNYQRDLQGELGLVHPPAAIAQAARTPEQSGHAVQNALGDDANGVIPASAATATQSPDSP